MHTILSPIGTEIEIPQVASQQETMFRLNELKGARSDYIETRYAIRMKFPWNLEVGDNSWFGGDISIYNQALIRIGSNVSQGTFSTTGSRDSDQVWV
jgi:acetyltransferase-like isoleucine patch superfamily enzyme